MMTTTKSEQETIDFARKLASDIQAGDVLLLHGNLGAGKSVFARALIRTLTGDENLEVPSPTFTLVQHYESEIGPLWHFDLYRLDKPEDIYELGWEEALSEGVVIVEWPERLGALKPAQFLDIQIAHVENESDSREIQITAK